MTIVAGDVIEAVRDRHPAFNREDAPAALCLRFASQAVRHLHGLVMLRDKDLLRVETNFPLPLADFGDGLALPENRTVVAVTVETTGASPRNYDIPVIPASARNDASTMRAAVWQIGDVLYLRGTANDWRQYGSIAVSTVPLPPTLLTLASVIDLPDEAFEALADRIAFHLAKRGVARDGVPPLPAAEFGRAADASEAAFLAGISARVAGRVFYVRDTARYFD